MHSMQIASELHQKGLHLAKIRPAHLESALYLFQQAASMGHTEAQADAEKALSWLTRNKPRLHQFFHDKDDECLFASTLENHQSPNNAREFPDALSEALHLWHRRESGDLHAWCLEMVHYPSTWADRSDVQKTAFLSVIFAIATTIERWDFRYYPQGQNRQQSASIPPAPPPALEGAYIPVHDEPDEHHAATS